MNIVLEKRPNFWLKKLDIYQNLRYIYILLQKTLDIVVHIIKIRLMLFEYITYLIVIIRIDIRRGRRLLSA